MTEVLLPFYPDPPAQPATWRALAALGRSLTVVAATPEPPQQLAELTAAGVRVLGRVDTGYSARPLADLLDEVTGWAGGPVTGVFLDHAPTSTFALGPVAVAARLARRCGLTTVVLNPGVPTDPCYRELGAAICTFEGPWLEYRRWSAAGSQPGDGHLVHSVPTDALPQAQALLRRRRAGFGLLTDQPPPAPYTRLPGWLSGQRPGGYSRGDRGRG
ncbi:hypothetical protein JQS43_18465 [Natronosporangium hydrolyticum]|uniref:Uncharacterized protein n=1 Tax=Natronosporangium hydrolyticum TaxID=2811111 RepID=A0A895Y753_9ACTN|nr:spherulation-specific family 4 protein [Natronosporangium hydrolyticum]QSB13557.1 hypothetical protein JQS43_18465 [Natronosporangium hydrolyticum]